jgi:flagellar basal body rod protein FlgG
MFLSSALSTALDRITERAADVRRAYTPGAIPAHDDVATSETSVDFTLDPLAVVAPEDAYFMTRDDRTQTTYTRNGAFTLRGGRLCDAEGQPILGARKAGEKLAPLSLDPVDDALGRVRDPRVERDGTFSYQRESVDPRSGAREDGRIVVGRLALARFPAGTRLESRDGAHLFAPAGVTAQIGLAGDGKFASLLPMHRERSRIDVDQSLARLKEAYLAFDALQAAEAAKAHVGKTVMDLLK